MLVALAPIMGQHNLHGSKISPFISNESFSFDVNGTNISFPKNGMFLIPAGFFVYLGSIMNLLGFAFFVGVSGLFKGKGWTLAVTVILTIITLVVGILFMPPCH